MTRINNILLDYGNVLWNLDIQGAFERLGDFWDTKHTPDHIETQIMSAIGQYETGHISTQSFVNLLLNISKPSVQALDIVQAWNSMLLDLPIARIYLLEKLRLKYKVYLLSNINPLHLSYTSAYLSEVHGIAQFEKDYFDGVFYSHLIKINKPNADAFNRVIEQAGIIPSETLFIDDVKANTNAAAKLGFQVHNLTEDQDIISLLTY